MTSKYSRQFDLSFDTATGDRVYVAGKLIKEYMKVEPFKFRFDTEQSAPQVRTIYKRYLKLQAGC